jgi:hypothetical protein
LAIELVALHARVGSVVDFKYPRAALDLAEISCREQTNTIKFPCEPCVEKQGAPSERKKKFIYRKENTELKTDPSKLFLQISEGCIWFKAYCSKHALKHAAYISEAPDGCSHQQVSMHI